MFVAFAELNFDKNVLMSRLIHSAFRMEFSLQEIQNPIPESQQR